MAAVYAARDQVLNRDVAVKVLAEHLNEDESARIRFQREARAAAGLSSHPHVVTIYDVGEHAGRSFIVMELLSGGSLATVLRSGREVNRTTAIGWLRDAASALDAAHSAGIVHRDIKPANLLLDDRGGLAIADFGIARIAESDQVTMTGQVLGTAAYLSPEQALGEPATAASDFYALAVVAFELLTGRRPFEGEHFAAQARAHIEQQPPRASEVRGGLSPAVDAALDRGLAKTPGDRWPTAMAFVDALEGAMQEAPEPATTRTMAALPPREPRQRRAAPAPAREHYEQPPPYRSSRGSGGGGGRRWAAVAAVVLALAAGGVALAAFGGDEQGGSSSNAGGSGDRAERTPTPTPTAEATPEPQATAEAEATATPEPTAEPEATPTPQDEGDSGGGGGDANALNQEGFALYEQGNYEAAIKPLQGAVDACGDSTEQDPCAYAIYNLGSSLHRSGRSAEAIPLLERRLAISNFKRGEVKRELKAAQAAAG